MQISRRGEGTLGGGGDARGKTLKSRPILKGSLLNSFVIPTTITVLTILLQYRGYILQTLISRENHNGNSNGNIAKQKANEKDNGCARAL